MVFQACIGAKTGKFQLINNICMFFPKGGMGRTSVSGLCPDCLYYVYQTLLVSPTCSSSSFSLDQAEHEEDWVGLCWHAAGSVWSHPTKVNVTAVFWVTPSVCDKPARPECWWHFSWYPTDLQMGPVQVLLSTVHTLKATMTFFHEQLFSCLAW